MESGVEVLRLDNWENYTFVCVKPRNQYWVNDSLFVYILSLEVQRSRVGDHENDLFP